MGDLTSPPASASDSKRANRDMPVYQSSQYAKNISDGVSYKRADQSDEELADSRAVRPWTAVHVWRELIYGSPPPTNGTLNTTSLNPCPIPLHVVAIQRTAHFSTTTGFHTSWTWITAEKRLRRAQQSGVLGLQRSSGSVITARDDRLSPSTCAGDGAPAATTDAEPRYGEV